MHRFLLMGGGFGGGRKRVQDDFRVAETDTQVDSDAIDTMGDGGSAFGVREGPGKMMIWVNCAVLSVSRDTLSKMPNLSN